MRSQQHLHDCQLFLDIKNFAIVSIARKISNRKNYIFPSMKRPWVLLRSGHNMMCTETLFMCARKVYFFHLFASCFHWAWKFHKALLFHIVVFFKLTRQVQMQFILMHFMDTFFHRLRVSFFKFKVNALTCFYLERYFYLIFISLSCLHTKAPLLRMFASTFQEFMCFSSRKFTAFVLFRDNKLLWNNHFLSIFYAQKLINCLKNISRAWSHLFCCLLWFGWKLLSEMNFKQLWI